jgi:hypothetical protein
MIIATTTIAATTAPAIIPILGTAVVRLDSAITGIKTVKKNFPQYKHSCWKRLLKE